MPESRPCTGEEPDTPACALSGQAEVEDLALARALRAGERWAGRVFWNRYWRMVFRIIYRTLRSHDESLDLTQEVFCQMLRSVRRLRDLSSLRSWIVSVTLRTLKWEIRRRRIREWVGLSSSGELPEVQVDAGRAEAHYAVGQFLTILDSLPDRVQTIFALRHFEGFELAEISAATGVSLATVKRDLTCASNEMSALVAGDTRLHELLRKRGQSHEDR